MSTPVQTDVDRREFITAATGLVAGAGLALNAQGLARAQAQPAAAPPPAPPGIDAHTLAEAEKLAKVSFNDAKRTQLLGTLQRQLDLYETLRAADLRNEEPPAEIFDPRLPGMTFETVARPPRFRPVPILT